MKKAFVTGWPINHSKSPKLHGYWLGKYEIRGSYEPLAIEPKDFKQFIGDLSQSGFCGGNVTIPHKEAAFELIPDRDEAAEAIGAANTIWLEDGKLFSGNTDAYGFSANLDDHAPEWRDGNIATVLGAGGASRAIIYSLIASGFSEIRIANRTLSKAQILKDQFGNRVTAHNWNAVSELLSDSDLLVNTTSIGLNPETDPPTPNISNMKPTTIVTDIVYTPLMTPLLMTAEKYGLKTVDGLGMLLHQAVPGFERWFGLRPEVTGELRLEILEEV